MRGLHRGDDVEPGEARDVGCVEDLRVLDAHAQIARAGTSRCTRSNDVERDAVGAIADGVDAGLEPARDAASVCA